MDSPTPPVPEIPSSDAIALKLARATTEAALLRKQLRLSLEAEKERVRLARLRPHGQEAGHGR